MKGTGGERAGWTDRRNLVAHRYHGAAVSCGFERRSRLKAISAGARRENGGVVGHTDKVKSKETAGARRERAAVPNEGGWGRRSVLSTNWTPAAWQYNYGPYALGRACAPIRYACYVTAEHATRSRFAPRAIRYCRYKREKEKERTASSLNSVPVVFNLQQSTNQCLQVCAV